MVFKSSCFSVLTGFILKSLIFILSGTADAQTRTWTSMSGNHTVEAELLGFDGQQAKIRKTDGTILLVALEKLSNVDREFVEDAKNQKPERSEPEFLPDNKSEKWKFVMRVASQGYIHGSKRIEPTIDGDCLLEMAQGDDDELASLSQRLVLRQVVNDSLNKSQSVFGEKFNTAVKLGQSSAINSSIRQLDDKFFGGGVDYLSEMESIMQDLRPIVQSGINQQVESLRLSRRAWVVESVVASQIAEMQEDEGAKAVSEGLSANTTYYTSDKKPFSAYKLVNKTETVIPWCIIVLHNHCEFTTPESEEFHNNLSNFLGEIFVGGNQPNFTERTKALEAYSDIDKTVVFFVENWQPKQRIKIVGIPAIEFFNTTDDIQITAYWTGCKQTFGIDVERYKKQLKKKFAPKPRRR